MTIPVSPRRVSSPSKWLGGLFVLLVAATPTAAGPSGPGSSRPSPAATASGVGELERLLAEAVAGRVPAVAVVDDTLAETPATEAGLFTATLRRTLGRPGAEQDGGARALYTLVAGFPARAVTRLEGGRHSVPAVVQLVDVGLEVALADASSDHIAPSAVLAAARLVAPEGAREARRRLQPVLEAALLRDENEARRALEAAFVDAAPGLEPAFVDALRAVATPKRLEMMVGLLGLRPASDGLVLNRVHGVALRLGPVLGEGELQTLRRYLGASATFQRIGAAQALGALEDRGAMQGLVSLLRDADTSVRNAAHDSLRQISAMTIGPSPERWQGWLAREEAWWQERGAHELERLAAAERGEVLAILRDASHHRLFRDEITAAAAPLLESDDSTVVRIALAALEGVRARGVELDIVELLEHPSSVVRAQAGACLRNLTGRMLPADAMSWRRALTP